MCVQHNNVMSTTSIVFFIVNFRIFPIIVIYTNIKGENRQNGPNNIILIKKNKQIEIIRYNKYES